ncbi:MAG: hypothetical protein RMK30_09160 [Anaerolineae bacterium]|nr:hypothetical protein [Anaerolineae bacterium]MDW8103031.1 hypothetical protein [Anaerolineae bacterium]
MGKIKRCFFTFLGFVIGIILARLLWPPRVIITWETASEIDTVGFFLYRAHSPDGPFVLIDATPVPSRGDPLTGASYRYEDRKVTWGQVYFYQLEELERDGNRRRYPEIVKGRAGIGWAGALATGLLTGGFIWSIMILIQTKVAPP